MNGHELRKLVVVGLDGPWVLSSCTARLALWSQHCGTTGSSLQDVHALCACAELCASRRSQPAREAVLKATAGAMSLQDRRMVLVLPVGVVNQTRPVGVVDLAHQLLW